MTPSFPSGRPVRLLFYAINGVGLGHLQRLHAIARECRTLCHALGLKADFSFITTSDAPHVATGFPVYKIPSKTTIRATDAQPRAFAKAAKILISNVTAALRPDLLVLDTMPQGAFHEYLFLRDYARGSVFIDRHKDRDDSLQDVHQKHLALYDRILVPDEAHRADHYPLSDKLRSRREFVGPITAFDPRDAYSREEARTRLAIPDDRSLIYVSAGGGGDRAAEQQLASLHEMLRGDPGLHLLMGYGPLFNGEVIHGDRVTPLREPNIARYFRGVDAAISAAGYNSYEELLGARVPTLFFAQSKGMDRQDLRIEDGVKNGFHLGVTSFCVDRLLHEWTRLERIETREALIDKMKERPLSQGSTRAALELLKLWDALKESALDRRSLFLAGGLRRDDPLREGFAARFRSLWSWKTARSKTPRFEDTLDRAHSQWDPSSSSREDLGGLLDEAQQLDSWRESLGWSETAFQRFAKSLLRESEEQEDASIRRLVEDTLDHLLDSRGNGTAAGSQDGESAGDILEELRTLDPSDSLRSSMKDLTDHLASGKSARDFLTKKRRVATAKRT